jgi:hypothetical protein
MRGRWLSSVAALCATMYAPTACTRAPIAPVPALHVAALPRQCWYAVRLGASVASQSVVAAQRLSSLELGPVTRRDSGSVVYLSTGPLPRGATPNVQFTGAIQLRPTQDSVRYYFEVGLAPKSGWKSAADSAAAFATATQLCRELDPRIDN